MLNVPISAVRENISNQQEYHKIYFKLQIFTCFLKFDFNLNDLWQIRQSNSGLLSVSWINFIWRFNPSSRLNTFIQTAHLKSRSILLWIKLQFFLSLLCISLLCRNMLLFTLKVALHSSHENLLALLCWTSLWSSREDVDVNLCPQLSQWTLGAESWFCFQWYFRAFEFVNVFFTIIADILSACLFMLISFMLDPLANFIETFQAKGTSMIQLKLMTFFRFHVILNWENWVWGIKGRLLKLQTEFTQ